MYTPPSAAARPRLLTLAVPRLAVADREFIDAFRAAHDPAAEVVEPHFTLLFGCAALHEAAYTAHVAQVAAGHSAIHFVCRYAMLGADDIDDSGYVFLVPDVGLSAIARLHDALYTGPMAPQLRLDLPYVPHITIGRSADRQAAQQWCAELNARGLHIAGVIDELVTGTPAEDGFQVLQRLPLER